MTNFSVDLYRPEDFPDFSEYIRNSFHNKYILADKKYLDWQYDSSIYLARKGAEIIGHFGFRDLNYKIQKVSHKVRVLMNLFVTEAYRSTGAGAALADKALSMESEVIVNGYTPLAEKLFSRIRPGFKSLGNLRRYLIILNKNHHLLENLKVPEINLGLEYKSDYFKLVSVSKIEPSLYDKFWAKAGDRYRITVERDPEYLSWRFLHHPYFVYQFMEARYGDDVAGYLVYRIEENNGFKIARIIDWVCLEPAEMFLLANFMREVKFKSVHAADFMCSGNIYDKVLKTCGFFNVEGTDFNNFPILFSPISYKKTFINVAGDISGVWSDCYITKADGDQDRPNPH